MRISRLRCNRRIGIWALAIGMALSLGACADSGSEQNRTGQASDADWRDRLTRQDRETQYESAQEMDLSGVQDAVVEISEDGDYLLTGDYEGKIVIDVCEDEIVHLYLNNVNIVSSDGPAMDVRSAAKVILTVMEDTENVFSDSAYYEDSAQAKACIYAVCDLTINGSGSLYVYGYYKDGIRSKDCIKILDSQLYVQTKGDCIRGNDGILIYGAALELEGEGCGLRTTDTGKDDRGIVASDEAWLKVTAGESAIYSAADVYLTGSEYYFSTVQEEIRAGGETHIE